MDPEKQPGVVVKMNTEATEKNGREAANTDMKQPISADNLRFATGGQEEQIKEKIQQDRSY